LRGSSVEAQALEIQMAKHKTQQMESQLREIIVLYGPGEAFYNEMMKTRRTIRVITASLRQRLGRNGNE
jgi:hypothetical protein